MTLRFLSLYSGIGLHDLGFTRAGIDIVGQVEIDPYCRAVLEQHWRGLPRWEDVRGVTAADVRKRCGRVDGITGGFACQDVSAAGKGAGLGRATRSGLTWREMFRLVRGLRPDWLVIENVPVLRGRGADRVLDALERIGYACWPVVVGAEHVGAPHRRHRVWIVGREAGQGTQRPEQRTHVARQGHSDLADAARGGLGADRRAQRDAGHADERGAAGDGQAVPAGPRLQGHRPDAGESQVAEFGDDLSSTRWPARPGEQQHEWEPPRLIPKTEGTPESGLGLGTHGRAARMVSRARGHALKALGNGNPPQVAELIGRAVIHLDNQRSPLPGGGRGRPTPEPGSQKEKP